MQAGIHGYRQAYRNTDIHTYRRTYRHTDRQTDRQAGRHTFRHTNIQTDIQTYIQVGRQADRCVGAWSDLPPSPSDTFHVTRVSLRFAQYCYTDPVRIFHAPYFMPVFKIKIHSGIYQLLNSTCTHEHIQKLRIFIKCFDKIFICCEI